MKSLQGHLLIAAPSLAESTFRRSVILMLDHSSEGAAGVILNRPTETTVTDIAETVFDEAFTWDKPLHLGGPVSGPLMVLHESADLSDREIFAGMYNTLEVGKVRRIIADRTEPALIVANYAGWGPGQLEGEFRADSWLTLPASLRYVFWDEAEDLWDAVMKVINAQKLSGLLNIREVPPDPRLN